MEAGSYRSTDVFGVAENNEHMWRCFKLSPSNLEVLEQKRNTCIASLKT